MSKVVKLPILITLATCGCCSGILVMFAPNAPDRDFSVKDLAIDESWFYSGWIKDYVQYDSQCFGGDLIGQYVHSRYSLPGENDPYLTLAWEDICKVDKTWRASLQYERYLGYFVFAGSDMATPPVGWGTWEKPPAELPFESNYADEWALKCQRNDETEEWYRCTYFARYKEYLLEFDVNTDNSKNGQFISFDELNQILNNIDERMGIYLYPKK